MNKILNKWIDAYDGAKRWFVVRDQPRYDSQDLVLAQWGGMQLKKGRKKSKGATLESVNEEWNEFKQCKEKKLEQLDKIVMRQEEGNQLLRESTDAKKMKMFVKLSSKEHLDDRSKELGRDLFEN
ncbi:hypothetical protein MTR_1g101850 [Medicago truncatula]|uniref:Uncharacterized protein n=1 Tax=Medicago truncatula TaxID=3880 RepID=G7IC25_MEDTR|nr:hypothetical protein MTR_1g101850 [Medicago truncatula]